jgi:hypothetical protein
MREEVVDGGSKVSQCDCMCLGLLSRLLSWMRRLSGVLKKTQFQKPRFRSPTDRVPCRSRDTGNIERPLHHC